MNKWRRWHRRIGIIVAIQVLLWICGGVVMSSIPIEMVRGNHLVEHLDTAVELQAIQEMHPDLDLRRWKQLAGQKRGPQVFIRAIGFDDQVHYLDPIKGGGITLLSEQAIRDFANQQYLGSGIATHINLVDTLPREVAHLSVPIYQVIFSDSIETHFYIDAFTGQVKSVRSLIWHTYDFFWMLHIMDYDTRKDFNNPLVITASVSALLFTFSGFVLLYFSVIKPKSRKLMRKLGRNVDNV
jgi:hypothetical protein